MRTTFLMVLCGFVFSSPTNASEPSTGSISLVGGDDATGFLVGGEDAQTIAWQHPRFDRPFEFPIVNVQRMSWPSPTVVPNAGGSFLIELASGDRVFGDVVALDDQTLTIRCEDHGDIVLDRSLIRRLVRWDGGESLAFTGPGDAADWRKIEGVWENSGGSITARTKPATIARDVKLPPVAHIELELSWQSEPDFLIAIGIDASGEIVQAAPKPKARVVFRGGEMDVPDDLPGLESSFRIEVWGKSIVAMLQSGEAADITPIGEVTLPGGRLAIEIELDQELGAAEIFSQTGQLIGTLTMPSRGRAPQTGFYIKKFDGIIKLDHLRISAGSALSASDDKSPPETKESKVGDIVRLAGRTTRTMRWTGVEADDFVFGDERFDATEVSQIVLQKRTAVAPEIDPSALSFVRCVTHQGMRWTGRWVGSSDAWIRIEPVAANSEIEIPVDQIRTVEWVHPNGVKPRRPAYYPVIVIDQTRLRGELVASSDRAGASAIEFSVTGGSSASVLPGTSGQILLRNEPTKANPNRAVTRRPAVGGVMGLFGNIFGSSKKNDFLQGVPKEASSITLKSGDVIEGEVTQIVGDQLQIKSALFASQTVSASELASVRLSNVPSPPEMPEVERERMMTVPRMRKKNPPTHLIVGVNGDLLRCRLKELNAKEAVVESRLETITIDRNLISQIVWLERREADAPVATEMTDPQNANATDDWRVQALLTSSFSMSLHPTTVTEDELIGTHAILGKIRLASSDIQEIWMGDAIGQRPLKQSERWQLRDATELELPEDGGPSDPGAGHPLVGKPAPQFKLQTLDGSTFDLSKQKGTVIVLDFWASWCGPCLQAMPMIESAVAPFDSSLVKLVAVNLQETEAPIRAVLNRLKIEPTVALDIDGVAASRYQANAIPQTVVIDAEGIVSRVFIGGGPKLGEQLQAAITASLTASKLQ